jgi:hypothetical protein
MMIAEKAADLILGNTALTPEPWGSRAPATGGGAPPAPPSADRAVRDRTTGSGHA